MRAAARRSAMSLVMGLSLATACVSGPERLPGPVISNFTIEPPVATPGGAARVRFEFRGAEGGLRTLGTAAQGVVDATGRHQEQYAPEQRGPTILYELRVTDRAGRPGNPPTVSLEVRM